MDTHANQSNRYNLISLSESPLVPWGGERTLPGGINVAHQTRRVGEQGTAWKAASFEHVYNNGRFVGNIPLLRLID